MNLTNLCVDVFKHHFQVSFNNQELTSKFVTLNQQSAITNENVKRIKVDPDQKESKAEREDRMEREKIRKERRKERERERRLEAKDAAMRKKSKITRDRDRKE
ncbi:hypothetical protein Tco_0498913 [Tanacetum coccineum]